MLSRPECTSYLRDRKAPREGPHLRHNPIAPRRNLRVAYGNDHRANVNASVNANGNESTDPVSSVLPGRREALLALGSSAMAVAAAAIFPELVTPMPAMAKLADYNFDPNAPIEEVSVQLGTEDGQYVFIPNTLEFTMGRIYKLKLRNPSTSTHYFTPLEFAEKIYTILVLAGDPAVEVKGGIQEVALKAGASATWVFIPIKPGRYPLRCTVKGHETMVGQLIIKKPQ